MALIKCPECGKEISDKSKACVNCGYPIEEHMRRAESDRIAQENERKKKDEELKKYKCNICGAQNEKGSDYCDNCGARITPYARNEHNNEREFLEHTDSRNSHERSAKSNIKNIAPKPPFWKRTWFITLTCIFFPPVGIALLWICRKPSKKKTRIILTAFLCLWTWVLFSPTDAEENNIPSSGVNIEGEEHGKEKEGTKKDEENHEKEARGQEESKKKEKEDYKESELDNAPIESREESDGNKETESDKKSTGEEEKNGPENDFLSCLKESLEESVAEKAYDILKNQIGFTNLEYKDKMDGLTNYEIKADGYNIILTASDDVYRIFIPNSSYTFYDEGEVKLTFSELENRTIDQYDRNTYYIMAQDIVCKALKNPSSAKFPSIVTRPEEISMQRNGSVISVQSYVDAKNDFNAKVRTDWIVEFEVIDMDTYSYNLIYANIGGQKYGEFLELE